MTTEKIIYIVTKASGTAVQFDTKEEAIPFAEWCGGKLTKEITKVTTLEYKGNGLWL